MPPCLEPKLDVLPAAQKQIWTKADVSVPAAVRVMFDAAERPFGGIDVLVNNAAS
jgi:NAD(P)-dependent dehydrogenase (short-subunit alcohol dehydrogenase family)